MEGSRMSKLTKAQQARREKERQLVDILAEIRASCASILAAVEAKKAAEDKPKLQLIEGEHS